MLLNAGSLNGARIVSADTVATMSRNHSATRRTRVEDSNAERSSDFTLSPTKGKVGHRVLISADGKLADAARGAVVGRHSNTSFLVDPVRGVAGSFDAVASFADSKALAVYDAFERRFIR